MNVRIGYFFPKVSNRLSTEKGIKIFTRKIILQVFGDGLNSESVSYGLKKMVMIFNGR